MMDIEEILKNVVSRLEHLEELVGAKSSSDGSNAEVISRKLITLPELARKANLNNGQLKITAVVGYNEKILNQPPIGTPRIKELWRDGKFSGSYAFIFLQRAVREGLVRENTSSKEATYDLTQSGEDLFDKILKDKADNDQ